MEDSVEITGTVFGMDIKERSNMLNNNFVEKPRAITGIDKNNDYISLTKMIK